MMTGERPTNDDSRVHELAKVLSRHGWPANSNMVLRQLEDDLAVAEAERDRLREVAKRVADAWVQWIDTRSNEWTHSPEDPDEEALDEAVQAMMHLRGVHDEPECVECAGEGTMRVLADCTTYGPDCACNGPRVEGPCPECDGRGVLDEPK